MEKRPCFRADMAGLGKYCTGGYGRIGVYRVKDRMYQLGVEIWRRVSSVVEHSSPNPKVPGSIPGPVSYRGQGL